jgi:hypothetical protein
LRDVQLPNQRRVEKQMKRYINSAVTLSSRKSPLKHYQQTLAPWLALATFALAGHMLKPGESVRADLVDVGAVRAGLGRRRDLPPRLRELCDAPPAAEADSGQLRGLAHAVCQALNGARGARGKSGVLLANLPRPAGMVGIQAQNGKAVVMGNSALDAFLDALDGADLAYIRRCPLDDCGRFFWAPRLDAPCCSKAHTSRYRVQRFRKSREDPRYRERQKKYEYTRKLKSAGVTPGAKET